LTWEIGVLSVIAKTAYRDRSVVTKLPAGYTDDVSRLNKTQVAEIWNIPSDPEKGEAGLRELLLKAQSARQHVSIAGARHSMGGQTIYPGGIVVNMLPFKGMALDERKDLLHVQAGAKWADIIPYLDRYGRSVGVMQSQFLQNVTRTQPAKLWPVCVVFVCC
jgi:FAD/FMN-containing dehydrogenase